MHLKAKYSSKLKVTGQMTNTVTYSSVTLQRHLKLSLLLLLEVLLLI